MPMSFPDAPVLDQEYVVSRELAYRWDGERWVFNPPSFYVITVTALDPIVCGVADAPFTLSVIGTGFTPGAEIRWDSTPVPTTFVSDTLLTCQVDPPTTGPADAHYVRVHDGPGMSVAQWFSVIEHPVTDRIDPETLPAGSAMIRLWCYGSFFSSGQNFRAQMTFDGVPDPTSILASNYQISTEFTPPATPTTVAVSVCCGPVLSLDPPLILTIT